MHNIYVIIATSKKRTRLLINRALKSVYEQEKVDPKKIKIIIVDDNYVGKNAGYSDEFYLIKKEINVLRKDFKLNDNEFNTVLLPNLKTKYHSGSGAWNTAIEYIKDDRKKTISYTAILDDDDEYKKNCLYECYQKIDKDTLAVFPTIVWKDHLNERILYFKKELLTPKNFFIGNPGVQGSNMFFRSDILEKIGGFDENLHSATDRDLMIRFLFYLNSFTDSIYKHIKIIDKPLVIHYADGTDRVTNDRKLKKLGLDTFYKKYKSMFSQEDFIKSIERSKKLFGYEWKGR